MKNKLAVIHSGQSEKKQCKSRLTDRKDLWRVYHCRPQAVRFLPQSWRPWRGTCTVCQVPDRALRTGCHPWPCRPWPTFVTPCPAPRRCSGGSDVRHRPAEVSRPVDSGRGRYPRFPADPPALTVCLFQTNVITLHHRYLTHNFYWYSTLSDTCHSHYRHRPWF